MDDEAIIESFRRGDESGSAALYNSYGRLVFAVCYRVLGDRSRAEDAVQQTFVQAWRAAASFDASRSLGPWLATIARRVSIDILRADKRHQNLSLDVPGSTSAPIERTDAALISVPPNAEQLETVWSVRSAIEALSPDDQVLIKMMHFEQAPHSEIADRLNIPVGTVKSRGFRIHRHLAAALASLREPTSDATATTGSGS